MFAARGITGSGATLTVSRNRLLNVPAEWFSGTLVGLFGNCATHANLHAPIPIDHGITIFPMPQHYGGA
jgi:hypothetical protein